MSEVAITITADGKAAVLAAKQAGDAIQSLGSQAEQAASHLQAAGKAGGNLAASSVAAKQAGEAIQSLGSQAGQTAAQAQAAGKATADMANRAGMSAKEMAAATRGIPAQFTDIVTSLASGQAPLTVLLQQGGQLKDQFHGIVPAIKAVGGYVAGLVNPFTVAAASVGVLYLAYQQGQKETNLLNQALLATGNITGTTTGQLNEMAKAMGQGEFTRGAAAAALAEMAGTGAIASKSLQGFTQTALDMQRYVGAPVEETAKVFKSLGDEPVKASLKLNDSLHYLTRTQYEQIKTLEEHSKKTDAAKIAQQAYSDALKQQIDAARANLGYLETSWNGVASAAKWAWDKMLNLGRSETGEDRLATARAKLDELQNRKTGWGFGVTLSDRKAMIAAQQAEVTYLERVTQATKDGAEAQARYQKQQEAGIKWSQEGEKYLTREVRLKKEIASIEGLGQAAGLSAGEIAARVAQARQEYDKAVASANADALIAAAKGNAKRYGDYYKQELDSFRLSTSDYLETVRALEAQALKVERRAVVGEKPVTAEDRIRQKSRLSELDAQIREVDEKYKRAVEDEDLKNQQVLERLGAAAGKALDPLTQAGQTFASQYGAIMRRAGADGNEAVLEAGRAVWETMADKAQFDSAKKLYEDLFARLTSELDAVRQAADLDGGLFSHIDAAGKADEIKSRLVPSINEALAKMREFKGSDLVSDKAVVEAEAEANVKKLTASSDPYFKKMADSIENSLTDALMRGFESGKGFAQNLRDTVVNLFKTTVLKSIVQEWVKPVAGMITSALGIPTAASAGGSGSGSTSVFSTASTLNSAYNLMSNGVSASITAGFTKLAQTSLGNQLGLSNGVNSSAVGPVQPGLSELGSSLNSTASVAAQAAIAYTTSKLLSGGYKIGDGKFVDAATIIGSYFDPTGGFLSGAIAGVTNRAFGKKLQEQGIEGQFGGAAGFAGNGYQYYKGGWFVNDKTTTSDLSEDTRSALASQYRSLQLQTGLMATTLGLGTDAIANFTASIRLNLQGLSNEQAQARLAEEFSRVSESMAQAALGTEAYSRTGETAVQTMTRLSGILTGVNGMFDTLGKTLYGESLLGADMAQQLADAFGGIDKLQSATSGYYQDYYSEAERAATTTRQLSASLEALGYALPANRDGFRALVEAQDLTTESGRTAYAALLQLAPAFTSLTASALTSVSQITTYLANLQTGTLSILDPGQKLASSETSYTLQLAAARAGDSTALGAITQSADQYLNVARNYYGSTESYADIYGRVTQQLSGLTEIPARAVGGYTPAGWTLVGEKGQELVNFTSPSRVYTAQQTADALGRSGSPSEDNGGLLRELIAEIRALRQQQGGESSAQTRQLSAIEYRLSRLEAGSTLERAR